MYKKFTKTKGGTYDDIARQAYGTTEQAGNIAKINNNIEEGEVLVFVEDKNTKAPGTKSVALQMGDCVFDNFAEYSLIDILGGVKGAVFVFNKTDINYSFKMGEEAIVFDDNGEIFLKGRIANIDNNLNSRANWSQIEIKSHAGVLIESDTPYPLESQVLSLKNILEEIAGAYNQKISFSDEKELNEIFTNEIGTSFTAEINEKAFSYMSRLCRSRGLLLTDTGDGLFIGRFKGNEEEKLNLIDGSCLGVKSIKLIFAGDGLGRYYEVNSQYPETATATVSIPYPVPIIKRYNSDDYNALDLKTIGEQIACTDIGKAFKVWVVLSENKKLKSGSFAILKNEKINIDKETDFVIETIIRKHPDETVLTLTLPCAYTYKIPETLPLT